MDTINTGNSTFDRKANGNYYGRGNVISDVQFSNYVRPFNETECNGYVRPEGYLRDFDLNHFKTLPINIREYIKFVTDNESVILYEVRHWNGNTKVVHGYVITKCHRNNYKLVKKFYIGRTEKSRNVVDVFAQHISN